MLKLFHGDPVAKIAAYDFWAMHQSPVQWVLGWVPATSILPRSDGSRGRCWGVIWFWTWRKAPFREAIMEDVDKKSLQGDIWPNLSCFSLRHIHRNFTVIWWLCERIMPALESWLSNSIGTPRRAGSPPKWVIMSVKHRSGYQAEQRNKNELYPKDHLPHPLFTQLN